MPWPVQYGYIRIRIVPLGYVNYETIDWDVDYKDDWERGIKFPEYKKPVWTLKEGWVGEEFPEYKNGGKFDVEYYMAKEYVHKHERSAEYDLRVQTDDIRDIYIKRYLKESETRNKQNGRDFEYEGDERLRWLLPDWE